MILPCERIIQQQQRYQGKVGRSQRSRSRAAADAPEGAATAAPLHLSKEHGGLVGEDRQRPLPGLPEDATPQAPWPHRVAQSRPKSCAEASTQNRIRAGQYSEKCIRIM